MAPRLLPQGSWWDDLKCLLSLFPFPSAPRKSGCPRCVKRKARISSPGPLPLRRGSIRGGHLLPSRHAQPSPALGRPSSTQLCTQQGFLGLKRGPRGICHRWWVGGAHGKGIPGVLGSQGKSRGSGGCWPCPGWPREQPLPGKEKDFSRGSFWMRNRGLPLPTHGGVGGGGVHSGSGPLCFPMSKKGVELQFRAASLVSEGVQL